MPCSEEEPDDLLESAGSNLPIRRVIGSPWLLRRGVGSSGRSDITSGAAAGAPAGSTEWTSLCCCSSDGGLASAVGLAPRLANLRAKNCVQELLSLIY